MGGAFALDIGGLLVRVPCVWVCPRLIKWYDIEQESKPVTMMGIETSRIRRRPIRSTRTNATSVEMKLVTAMDRDVRVGEENPRSAKIVAEKYIREF